MSGIDELRENFGKIKDDVTAAGGYKSIPMRRLREAAKAGRLDDGPINLIRHNLSLHGLEATSLERDQAQWVLIYETQSPVGRVVTAIRGGEDADRQLRSAIDKLPPAKDVLRSDERDEYMQLREIVTQIRALVGPT
jgi:hypothetical protein